MKESVVRKYNISGLKKGWELAKTRKKEKNNRVCKMCGKKFYRTGNRDVKYCSLSCRGISQRGEVGRRKGMLCGKKIECKNCGDKTYKTKGQLLKAGNMFCSKKCAELFLRGKNSPHWKGGKTKERDKIRKSKEYKLWRESVFKRDGYTCIWCGKVGGTLNADHIKPSSLFPELRFAIDNGRTLCIECHKTTDSYLNNKIK